MNGMNNRTGLVVAVFDFDGTLTKRDTLLPFLRFITSSLYFSFRMVSLLPVIAAYFIGLIQNNNAKQKLLFLFLAEKEFNDLRRKAEFFAESRLPKLVRPQALQRLLWHRNQGHRCIVLSASLELYLQPWAVRIGGVEAIGTQLEITSAGFLTGKLLGDNCYGKEKLRRLEAVLGPLNQYIIYAYGDSFGDRELLSMADYAYYRKMPNEQTS